MVDLQELLNEKDKQLSQLQQEFTEYQEMSKTLEEELESELEAQIRLNSELQAENQSLKDQVEKINKDYYHKLIEMEKSAFKLQNELKETQNKLKMNLKSNKELETELDIYKSKLREKEFEIEELTETYNQTLEELAITCSELDGLKDFNAESTHRLKEQLNELSQDLEIARDKTFNLQNHSSNFEKAEKPKLKDSMVGQSALTMVDLLLSDLNGKIKQKQCDI
ncbi:unnamed protein product [Blepharisma stoltei]|uniref:Uncharacterized protein n=1 Tax=Blepharisma stoltei TaxID=1481888 RepID=A0AAU9JYR0_9CILI|nr:unnamed protein product [Blepharisma stoltei]